MIVFILCALPNLFRAWQDRKGQTKQRKLTYNLIVYGAFLAVVLPVTKEFVSVPLLTLLHRVCWFDYAVHAFLKKFSESHKGINIWTYTGESTYWWDQWIAKVPPWLRLALRLCLFVVACWWFLN